ncbi:conserved hypothetical protein [Theileria equi strain WA]|uniref:Uncharacterized protein n=1 Tax=Theileria equi strain WA TaxID=1537102 RepID=L1LDQ4_THEEQ|nr:conserved hypothetical protein [Theileria equi strain WA]EKX73582.1 conserved hypothetical protein [Theileria equi strain WA]|eukprot:XP_004833034.1 conserved hypothetical protein [Theileria equi strain WA]
MPIIKTFKKEQNIGYKFLKNEWGYLDHSRDPEQPAGILEGGPQNYDGKGLEISHGKDRHRTETFPYPLDHGYRWRQRGRPGAITFFINPDAYQSCAINETDLDLERRQWGSWHQPAYTRMPYILSAWKSSIKHQNAEEVPYPWLTRWDVFERTPVYQKPPPEFIMNPDMDLKLAAVNRFAGYMPRTYERVEEELVKQKKLIREWDRLEALYNETNDQETLNRMNQIKKILFNPPEFEKTDSPVLKAVAEAALIRARNMLRDQANYKPTDPEYIEYHLRKSRPLGSDLAGDSNYTGEERTVVLNLISYHPIGKTFRRYTSIEEMAEAYHIYLTEARREGRNHVMTKAGVHPEYQEYLLRNDRRKFPAIQANYAPIWAHRKFGPEFGDAIRDSQKLPENALSRFGTKLKKRKRRLNKHDRSVNYVDDYHCFEQEYNY